MPRTNGKHHQGSVREKSKKSKQRSDEIRHPTNLAQLLLRALYWIEDGIEENYQRRGGDRLTRAQSLVMMNIGEGIRRPSAIAERLGISRQAVHQSMNGLVKLGLIELVPDPDDRRAVVASMSRKGEPMRMLAIEVLADLEKELGRRIGEREVATLRRVLEKDWGELAVLNQEG